MDDEPLRRSRVLATIGMLVAIAVVVVLVGLHDRKSPISDLPLVLIGLFLVALASGAALLGAIRVVLLSRAIRHAQAARWSTSEPSE
jgi:hypothetical protein